MRRLAGVTAAQPTTFGADAAGHVFVGTATGQLFRIDPARGPKPT